MKKEIHYQEDVQQITCKEKHVTIHNFTPIYTAQEQKKVKDEINQTLYQVFSSIKAHLSGKLQR